jgi:hypothetical protein
MSKSITFIGGMHDGETFKTGYIDNLPKEFLCSNGTYFAESSSGGMDVMRGKRNNLWHSFSADIYEKTNDDSTYQFLENRMIERCSGEKNNARCMNPVINKTSYCIAHTSKK